MRTWREVRNIASQKFRLTPDWRRYKRCVENNIFCYAPMISPFLTTL